MLVSSTPQNTTPELSPINVTTVAQYLTFCGGLSLLFEKDFLETTTMTASQALKTIIPYLYRINTRQEIAATDKNSVLRDHFRTQKAKCLARPHHFYEGAPLSRWSPTHAPKAEGIKGGTGRGHGMFDDTFRPPLFWRELRGCVTVFPSGADEKGRLPEMSVEKKKKKI